MKDETKMYVLLWLERLKVSVGLNEGNWAIYSYSGCSRSWGGEEVESCKGNDI